jgi:hypothetical protein
MRLMTVAMATSLAAFTASSTGVRAQDSVGVESCDKFLTTYQACVASKVPEASRGPMTAAFDQMKTNWKAVAATAEGKAKLDATCKETAETMKKQVAALNCAW